MKKIAVYQKTKTKDLLVIWQTPKEKLIGEVYPKGEYKRGKWSMRGIWSPKDKDATEYRIREYFGFNKDDELIWK